MMLTVDEVEGCRNLLEDCAIFHFGSLSMTHEGCCKATQRAIQIAKDAGAVISFDPNLREPLWSSLEEARERIQYGLRVCDILKISDNEITWLTGEEDYDKAVAKLKEQYDIPLILVSLGRDGSLAYTAQERAACAPFLQENTIETTGAGDTFCAGILHSVLELGFRDYTADELERMLRTANAGASIVTTRKGALRVMPSPAQIQELLDKA
jgi:fructokinase